MTLPTNQVQLQRYNQRLSQFDGAPPDQVRQLEEACNERLHRLVAAEISAARPRTDSSQRSKVRRIENLVSTL